MEESYVPSAWDDLEGVTPPSQTQALIGHEAALGTLLQNYKNNRLHHAWLLSGPKGIGKATLAMRFAEHMLRFPDAANAPEKLADADDRIFSQASKGAHPNILVLRKPWDQKAKKFKTQITVDEIRKTASFLHMASGADAWRIVLVDPADDMNNNAANALLKILEEPPPRTIFFVLAHSPRGLLATIRSRCQVLPLKPLGDGELLEILRKQPLTADLPLEELAHLITHAKGSARRALLLADSGVLEIFVQFLEIVSSQKSDIGNLHRLAGQLAPASKSSEYSLFMDLIYDHMDTRIRDLSSNDQIAMNRLSNWASLWYKTREANMRAETWNMDKKQVILDLYADLRGA